MSAFGPKQTSLVAPHMSAIGCKADMAFCGNSLLRSLLGAKRTCHFALHMSAYDPKRTLARLSRPLSEHYGGLIRWLLLSLGAGNETARQGRRKSNKNAIP